MTKCETTDEDPFLSLKAQPIDRDLILRRVYISTGISAERLERDTPPFAMAAPPLPIERQIVYICGGGGQLEQLKLLADRMPFAGHKRRWITFDSPQSRGLLHGESVDWVPSVAPGDYIAVSRLIKVAPKLLGRSEKTAAVVSTGPGMSIPFLAWSALRGTRTIYFETATSKDVPSRAGRAAEALSRRFSNVEIFTQNASWADRGGWRYAGSVLDQFGLDGRVVGLPRPIRRVFVSLGLGKEFKFDRLVDRLHQILEPEVEVIWQTGTATRVSWTKGAGHVYVELPRDEFLRQIEAADVMITHAASGAALTALTAGACPVLIPREREYHEFHDDHQKDVASLFESLGLAVTSLVDDLQIEHLNLAASRSSAIRLRSAPLLDLDGSLGRAA